MKKEVHVHPDQKVIIRIDGTVEYVDTIENFEADYGQSLDKPTGQWNQCLYIQGEYCRCGDGFTDETDMGPWEIGDDILENKEAIKAAKELREAPVEKPSE